MKRSAVTRAFVAAFASLAFLWALSVAASPELHSRLHKDANQPGHSCAITLIASGSVDHSPNPPLIGEPTFRFEFQKRLALNPISIASPFLLACIFEHAPPALA